MKTKYGSSRVYFVKLDKHWSVKINSVTVYCSDLDHFVALD